MKQLKYLFLFGDLIVGVSKDISATSWLLTGVLNSGMTALATRKKEKSCKEISIFSEELF